MLFAYLPNSVIGLVDICMWMQKMYEQHQSWGPFGAQVRTAPVQRCSRASGGCFLLSEQRNTYQIWITQRQSLCQPVRYASHIWRSASGLPHSRSGSGLLQFVIAGRGKARGGPLTGPLWRVEIHVCRLVGYLPLLSFSRPCLQPQPSSPSKYK